ncbi:MAG: hypothetical protein COY68_04005 [Candidatus Levybacteria bacterium CG_4_10_14_0_8_um_filter_35_23]|nr:MAG: hypothetical protein COY68_04005 [Candidatus Levybacteria bacterium CG_4_10_14_0_8_um_filter_35_23]
MRINNSEFRIQNLFRWFPIVSILFVSAFLRLYRIRDYMTFLGDEGRDAIVVYNILHGKLTLLGPTASVGGFFLGPIYYYFMAVFTFIFNYDPVGPSVMVAVFGIATVWLVYKVCNEFFGKYVATVAALLYAVSPIVVAYSRSSWNPNPLPFFSLLILYLLYKALTKNKKYLFIVSGFLLGIALQLHYLALFLGVVLGFYIFLSNIKSVKNLPKLISGLTMQYFLIFAGFLVGWLPFLAFEFRHGFPNIQSIFNFIFHSGQTGKTSQTLAIIYDVFFRLFGRLVASFPTPEKVNFNNPMFAAWYLFILLLGVISILTLILKLFKSFKKENIEYNKYLLLFSWVFFGILMFGFYKKTIYEYYFGFMFPVPFILVGLSILELKERLPKFGKIAAPILVCALFLINIQGVPFRYEPNRQLNQMEQVSNFVFTKTDAKPFNFALISGNNSDHAYRYFFTVWGRPPVTIEYSGKDPLRKSVMDQLFVVCESLPCRPEGNSLWEIAGFGRAQIVGEWNVSVVKVYKLEHYKGR